MKKAFAVLLLILTLASLCACEYNDGSYYLYDENDDGSITVMGITETYSSEIEIPESIDGKTVSAIGDDAFYNNSDIRKVTLPDSVVKIGKRAFADSENLVSIDIGQSCRIIEDEAFEGCKGLKSIVLSEKLETVGYEAFAGCMYLAEFAPPATLQSIGINAFDNCEQLVIVTDRSTVAAEYAKQYDFPTDFGSTDRYTFLKIVILVALVLAVVIVVGYFLKKRKKK